MINGVENDVVLTTRRFAFQLSERRARGEFNSSRCVKVAEKIDKNEATCVRMIREIALCVQTESFISLRITY